MQIEVRETTIGTKSDWKTQLGRETGGEGDCARVLSIIEDMVEVHTGVVVHWDPIPNPIRLEG